MFNVKITKVTVIPGGTIGTVEAMDGERISDGFLLGKKVIDITLYTKELNISNLNPGVYIIKIKEGEASATRKLIVN